ncbi:AbiV family abortive infection protein [Sphingosinicella sp. CPCC 101087]|uniref:AbiV family abortive infection protein n=1 Tax=Sphingosinicella sp. CPCC 101087 TaxID=2497754 RepID=UPI00101D19E7|nr:AbiV family abortive infection protein [Sphingosinicella sp. CPCC 101087]
MSEDLIRNRQLCLDHAEGFIVAAERVGVGDYPHIVYHLSLLALEEVGKASMIGGQLATGGTIENRWMDKALESHRRKLQWAIWSPIERIDPKDFEAAREFAERMHDMRLASLYVDARAQLADVPAGEVVQAGDAEHALALARARLDYERACGTPDPDAHRTDDALRWFLDIMADPEQSRRLLSKAFIAKYHALDNDARAWITWARHEFARIDEESRTLLQAELVKPAAQAGGSKPKWRANAIVYTPSHSLRPKVLQRWNAQIEAVQLLWSGKKDQFTLQLTLNDNAPLTALPGRLAHLTKLVVACLNIGSIGYFWFERPGFERQMFNQILDLENDRHLELGSNESFWGDRRAVALTEAYRSCDPLHDGVRASGRGRGCADFSALL